MIITRTPFRISFCGGGSDLPAFYEKYGGCVISTTINKYMYISLHPYFDPKQISLKYSQTELVDTPDQIEHRIFKEILKQYGISGVEITSTADIPAGTGLGSSSAFTVGLLHALNTYTNQTSEPETLAAKACDTEINRLGAPIGKQDQYAAAFGGLNFIEFLQDGTVDANPLEMSSETMTKLNDQLILLYTGKLHNANKILSNQKANISEESRQQSLLVMCHLARKLKNDLEAGKTESIGELLHENWMRKKTLTTEISDSGLDDVYQKALDHGAAGGKILGAGGGGFFLFACDPERRQELKAALGLREFPFRFEAEGTRLIFQDTAGREMV